MPYFLNGIIRLPFLELYIVIFRDVNMKTRRWSAKSIESGLALYWWQRLITFGVCRIRVNIHKCFIIQDSKRQNISENFSRILVLMKKVHMKDKQKYIDYAWNSNSTTESEARESFLSKPVFIFLLVFSF